MKSHIAYAIAAAFAAGAVTFTAAQTAQTAPPATLNLQVPDLVSEPVASAAKLDGPGAEFVKSIVDSLNAEPSLKNSKITVQAEDDTGNIVLTGATMTPDQVKKATEIASAQAGEGKVVNAMQPDWHPSQAAPVATPTQAG